MKRKKKSLNTRFKAVFGNRKKQIREFELFGGAALSVLSVIIGGLFLTTSLQHFLVQSPQVAAVISGVLVDLTNGDRAANNLSPLTINPQLVAVAQAKANDMAAKGYFSHVTPEGHDPWYWFKQEGYAFEYAGENLAVDFTDSMDVERAWMQSPTHRKNILDPHFTEIGIATAVGTYQGRTTIFVAQAFGKPSATKQQAPVRAAIVPRDPEQTAVAQAKPVPVQSPESETVLGSRVTQVDTVPVIEPAVAAELAVDAARNKPLWSYLVGFPRDALRNAYFVLGILILLALAIDTGLEIRWHHRKRALRAGAMLAVMALCFVIAEFYFFTEPVIALVD